jgi:general secretion pathway protein G
MILKPDSFIGRTFAIGRTQPASAASTPRRHGRGFTLIELMIALVIIGVMGALIVPNVMGYLGQAKVTAAQTDIKNLIQALQLYKAQNQRYPTNDQGLGALVNRPTAAPVPPNWMQQIPKLPNDPWGRPYQYAFPGVHGEVDVFSLGADGNVGGEGPDADIGSWQ